MRFNNNNHYILFFVLLVSIVNSIKINGDVGQKTWSEDSYQPTDDDYYTIYDGSAVGQQFIIKPGKDENGIAYAAYSNDMDTNGWGYLSLTTNNQFPDVTQASAAGYLEGFISQSMIYQNWFNMYVNEYNQTISEKVSDWMVENVEYMQQQVQENSDSVYWQHINLVITQLFSMVDGYNNATTDSTQALTLVDFMLMNSDGDMIDLGPALNYSSNSVKESINMFIRKTGHCSSLIKLTDDLSDLYSSHTTWSSYFEMVRMFKIYNFGFTQTATKSSIVMFSSYPAALSSIDDFYLLDSKLVVIETTNGIINADNPLYAKINSSSVLSWVRVIVSNRLASGGKDWCDLFSIQNSGTYNNQWIIVDYNKFTPYKTLSDGALYILEQIPEYIEYEDVTPILRTGYWPSYNIPFFETVYNLSGFNNTAQYGNWFSYESSPRAEIFRRDANKVSDFTEMKAIMRYNNWQNDPLSLGNAGNQICSRFDLVTKSDPTNPFLDPGAFGGIDSKAVNYFQVDKLLVSAQSGPTHDTEKPFNWKTKEWESIVHVGMPDYWDFDWVEYSANN